MRVLKLESGSESDSAAPVGGIKELAQWEANPRLISLYDRSGVRLADFTTPDHNMTPRVVELLRKIIETMENERQGGGPALHSE